MGAGHADRPCVHRYTHGDIWPCHDPSLADSHACAQADNRMRAWWGEGVQNGLLCGCTHGALLPCLDPSQRAISPRACAGGQ